MSEARTPADAGPQAPPSASAAGPPQGHESKTRPGLAEATESAIATAVATANCWGLGAGIIGAVLGAVFGVIVAVLRGVEPDWNTTLVLAVMGMMVMALGTGFLLGIVGYGVGLAFGAVQGALKAWSVPAAPAHPASASFGQNLHDHRGTAVTGAVHAGQAEVLDGVGAPAPRA
jgi:hypothetical protein